MAACAPPRRGAARQRRGPSTARARGVASREAKTAAGRRRGRAARCCARRSAGASSGSGAATASSRPTPSAAAEAPRPGETAAARFWQGFESCGIAHEPLVRRRERHGGLGPPRLKRRRRSILLGGLGVPVEPSQLVAKVEVRLRLRGRELDCALKVGQRTLAVAEQLAQDVAHVHPRHIGSLVVTGDGCSLPERRHGLVRPAVRDERHSEAEVRAGIARLRRRGAPRLGDGGTAAWRHGRKSP
eukprot:4808134-Prymnesium_polylepis.2